MVKNLFSLGSPFIISDYANENISENLTSKKENKTFSDFSTLLFWNDNEIFFGKISQGFSVLHIHKTLLLDVVVVVVVKVGDVVVVFIMTPKLPTGMK